MLIDSIRNFVFVHIPKTAGSSMHTTLKPLIGSYVEVPAHRPVRDIDTTGRFSFAFVRNPFERLLSFYHYILQADWLGKNRHDMDRYERIGFKRFLMEEEFRVPFTGHHDLLPAQKLPQKYWVSDEEGNIVVDFVGRFENLHSDFRYVCDQIGFPAALPHVAQSRHDPWQDVFDDEMIQFVQHHHREDFDEFGYST